jgi:hypothetical protein
MSNREDVLNHIAEVGKRNRDAHYLLPGALDVLVQYARIGVDVAYPKASPDTAEEKNHE